MRINWIDRWRGALIVCIVIFHVIGMVQMYIDDMPCLLVCLKDSIRTFHVVSFFAITAVLWKTRDDNLEWLMFLRQKSVRLLLPYFSFGVLMCFAFWVSELRGKGLVDGYISESSQRWFEPIVSLLLGRADRAVGPLWFLPCLFWVLVLYRMVAPYLRSRKKLLLAAVCFFVLRFFVRVLEPPYVIFNFWLSLDYLVYFCLAKAIINKEIPSWIQRNGLIGAVVGMLFILLAGSENLWAFVSGASLWIYPCKFLRSCCGLWGFLCLIQSFNSDLLVRVGRDTLGILVMHKLIIVPIQFVCCRINLFAKLASWQVGLFSIGLSVLAIAFSMIGTSAVRRVCPLLLGERRKNEEACL